MSGIASAQESTITTSAQESAIVPAKLQTREDANQALVNNAAKMKEDASEVRSRAIELQEMSAHIPREYCDEKGKPKEVGGWEVIFAKFFMLTHPVMKLREFLNGGKPYLNPSSSEQVMYNKHMHVLKLDKYHRKKNEYFPEDKTAKPDKNAQVTEASPVAA